MVETYIFVLEDYHQHGGHVKSFFSQFMALKESLAHFHIVCSKDGFVSQNLEKFGIEERDISTYPLNDLRKWKFSLRLSNIIRGHLKDNAVLHVYSPECYFSALLAKKGFKNVVLVHSVLGGPLPFMCLPSTDLYIAVSKEQKERVAHSEKRCNIVVIKNRIKIETNIKSSVSKKNKRKFVLVVSRYDKEKIKSLSTIEKVVKKIPKNIDVVFVGEGNILDEYSLRFQNFPNVRFIGYEKNILKFKNEAGVVLGMGRSILEFMLHGTPAILTGFNGIQLLDTVESVKFASNFNFSGRELLHPGTPKETANKIKEYIFQNGKIEQKIVSYLQDEYEASIFPKKYMKALKNVNGKKTHTIQIVREYLYISLLRITNYIKYRNKFFKA